MTIEIPTQKQKKHSAYDRANMVLSPYGNTVMTLAPHVISYRLYLGKMWAGLDARGKKDACASSDFTESDVSEYIQTAKVFSAESGYDQAMVSRTSWKILQMLSTRKLDETFRHRAIRLLFHWMKHFWDAKAQLSNPDLVPVVACPNGIAPYVSTVRDALNPANELNVRVRYAHLQSELRENVDEPELLKFGVTPFNETVRLATVEEFNSWQEVSTNGHNTNGHIVEFVDEPKQDRAYIGDDGTVHVHVGPKVPETQSVNITAEEQQQFLQTIKDVITEQATDVYSAMMNMTLQETIEKCVKEAIERTHHGELTRYDRMEAWLQRLFSELRDETLGIVAEAPTQYNAELIKLRHENATLRDQIAERERKYQEAQEIARMFLHIDEQEGA